MAERRGVASLLATIVTWIVCFSPALSQVLTPPYFNLAVSKRIQASSTCGVGVSEPELYCKLTGANRDVDVYRKDGQGEEIFEVIQGQWCARCDPRDPKRSHDAEQAVDQTERWWQSPPLSRGLKYNSINLTVDLGQEYHVAYVFIKMANSPRPGVFALEKSNDYGQTWTPWQFFADTLSDCHTFFGEYGFGDRITSDDTVICTTEYSKVVPLEGGEIVVSLVNNRPSANNFSYSSTLQDWTKATNIRLRLIRTKTLLGHLMAVAREDTTVTRRYYYSIKDISIGGRCVCNGHADVCDRKDPNDPYKLLCQCQHNTCGPNCDTCCPGFVQKPWQPATLDDVHTCEPCQCYGHSDECFYDSQVANERRSIDISGRYDGGGVCQHCRHDTEGINCEKCKSGFYRPAGVPLNSTQVCQRCSCDPSFSTGECEEGTGRCLCRHEFAGSGCDRCNVGYYGYPRCIPCQCSVNGTLNQVCEVGGGQCPCKPNYDGLDCDRCAYGYYGFPDCKPCACNTYGSLSNYCDPASGQCNCQSNFGGRDCGECEHGYSDHPSCDMCRCNPAGTTTEICDKVFGSCLCRESFAGAMCDTCAPGSYRYPDCVECGCNPVGSRSERCNPYDGQCECNGNFAGRVCDRCAAGYYKYPECLPCNCDSYGAYGRTCDQESGECNCRSNFEGVTCSKCVANFYNYPYCEECNCNPAGAKEVPGYPLGGCGAYNDGRLCDCKDRVGGRICDTCKAGYWNLDIYNPYGCEDCNCHRPGTVGGSTVCGVKDGQCTCKPLVSDRRCSECKDGTYNMQESSVFGCQDCGCDVGGSVDNRCDKQTGLCNCRPRVNGRTCETPLAQHFFPTLFHMQYEMEDGRTTTGGQVRYGFDETVFADYSWRGYAIYSRLQDEVLVDVDVKRPSLYRLIFRFHNPLEQSITADVTLTPDTATDVQQTSTVVFVPTRDPQFVTVSGGGIVSTFVLNPGRWSISLKTPERLYVDYLVLLPQSYYEATILQQHVNKPCLVPGSSELCNHYTYVDTSSYDVVRADTGYVRTAGGRERVQLYPERRICDMLGTSDMALLDQSQNSMFLNLPISNPGKYIFLVQYHSTVMDRNQELEIDVASPGGRDRGRAYLPGCQYSSLCRQVVVGDDGQLKVFSINDSYVSITVSGRADINLALDTIIAVPVDYFTAEFIQPRFYCVRRNGECIPSTYPFVPGTVRTEIETYPNEDLVATDLPPNIIDTSVKVIKLDGTAPEVRVKTSVNSLGQYVFLTHYYQPYHTGFDVDVKVFLDSIEYIGVLRADYCPSASGCRARIDFPDAPDGIDLSTLDVTISFNNTRGRPVWLDYIMVITADQYTPTVTEVNPVDKSEEFIIVCGANDFYIDSATSEFCRDAVYSLTTDYNNGAQRCDCNVDGTLRFNCEEFGGQCPCRPDVIGRTCSQCRTGYYGFPNCRPCNCPSGLCDAVSGQCVCPPRVTGPNCNVCLPRTFGFDPLIGCEECSCDPYGVMNNQLDCNINDGKCSCKPNVDGRRCETCMAGYYSFPRCLPCSCDSHGTTDRVCDQRSAECLCKDNVVGPQCSQCKPSTFYLEDRNVKGCAQCFCFGTTQRCDSTTYRRSQVIDMDGWGITNLKMPMVDTRGGRTIEARLTRSDIVNPDEAIYWIAPEPYLGNKVTSYGGKLTYTVKFRLPTNEESHGFISPDIRIEGNNMTIGHISGTQPDAGVPLTVEVDLLENKFQHEPSGAPVSREQFMMVLAGIQAMQIRASYYTVVRQVTLSDVSIDIASADGGGALARNVEQCQCPPSYRGTSCEDCAEGYYRSRTGPYLGVCIPCECNGKASRCDPASGECINCRDNFSGPQCLSCRPGHYQDAQSGVCRQCACPTATNNFAETCEVDHFGQTTYCQCYEGYVGRRCDACELGYWGNPHDVGGLCRPCDCSGNIDIRDPTSCDMNTGACLKCSNDAAGERCDRCRDWYYGDAVDVKNCQTCACERLGSEMCDHRTGACLCKPNVGGATCDRCLPGTFGFDSGNGCQACDCGQASYGPDCDVRNGQCQCRPGVTGRRCDQCENGYWNYGPRGCEKCNCEFDGATTCDPMSGRCQCLPGVTGAKCDQCLNRWVMVPDQGCLECDSCVHLLLDDVETMDYNITLLIRELQSVSIGVGTIRRLEQINNTVHQLRPKVDGIIRDPTDAAILDPLKDELLRLQDLATKVRNQADHTEREADVVEMDAGDTLVEAEALLDLVNMGVDSANGAVDFAKDVLDDIQRGIEAKNIDEMLAEAEDILDEILGRDFDDNRDAANDELVLAAEALARVKGLEERAREQENRTLELAGKLEDIRDKLEEMRNFSRHTIDDAQAAKDLNMHSRRLIDEIKVIAVEITAVSDDIDMMLTMARDLLSDARDFLDDARKAYLDVERESSRLDIAYNRLSDFVDELSEENRQLRPLVDNATEHARKLQREAEFLESMIRDTKESAEAALNASKAYQAIVDAINDAMDASSEAIDAAVEAIDMSQGLAERARKAKEKSIELKSEADIVSTTVEVDLRPRLEDAKAATDRVDELNRQVENNIRMVSLDLDNLPEDGYSQEATDAAMKAMDAQQKAQDAEDRIQDIVGRLPEDQRKATQIPIDIAEANSGIKSAQIQVNNVMALVPEATSLLDLLYIKSQRVNQIGLDLTANITALRDKISVARGQANLIRVGVDFSDITTLRVRNPINLLNVGSYSKLSLFFRTVESNGFLAYLGPDRTSVQQQTDFMALEVINGRVVFTFDLGSGATKIEAPKNVADGLWHEVIAERTGKSATLTVRSDEEADSVATGNSDGTFSVLDLDRLGSRFYIGGVPGAAGLETKLNTLRYKGCIENVKLDGVPIGLWNFVYGENNNNGCPARDGLPETPPSGFRFDGNGYIILNQERFRPTKASAVNFKFKSFSEDGLMFYMGKDKDFFSIELQGGHILFQYNLGSGKATLLSDDKYNDGQWHSIEAVRVDKDGLLKVDGITVDTDKSPGFWKSLEIDNTIFIGGYKGMHNNADVTNKGFEGCIKDVTLGSTVRDLNDHLEVKGALPGCPEIARVVTFSREVANSYIAMDPIAIDRDFTMTFKIKSLERDGLVFYTTDDSTEQQNAFSISVVDGKVVVVAAPEGRRTVLETSSSNYNDGAWHYISVTKVGKDLQLDVDDIEMVTTSIEGRRRIETTSPLYFGGVRPGYAIVKENVGTEVHFSGCIGDVTVNGNFINFANAAQTNQLGASLKACPIPDPIPESLPTSPLPPPPPFVPDGSGPVEKCALPIQPAVMEAPVGVSGTRFGAQPDARFEFERLPGTFNIRTNFTLEFQTTAANGLIFYMADERHVDFMSLYMKDGQVNYAFNCGTGKALLTSGQSYNDGRWHKVIFNREEVDGTLIIDDGFETVVGQSEGTSRSINVLAPFFVGGISREAALPANSNVEDVTTGFIGCLRDLTLEGISFGEPSMEYNTQPCSGNVESGSFFYEDGGHIVLKQDFSVGLDLDIVLEVKPRSLDGVLLSVYNAAGDYLVLQLVDGKIIFAVENGGGEMMTDYSPPSRNMLCDGKWHSIKAVKAKNVVTLSVDGVFSVGIGPEGVSSTDTHDPLYVGGVPEFHKGIRSREQYVGCIRNLDLGNGVENMALGPAEGHVDINACPTN